jgi:hypothetical protein
MIARLQNMSSELRLPIRKSRTPNIHDKKFFLKKLGVWGGHFLNNFLLRNEGLTKNIRLKMTI